MKRTFLSFYLLLGLSLSGCQTAYYEFWERLGVEKRELLQDHVKKVNREQSTLKQEFKDTLERIRTEYKFSGGQLEKTYDRLSEDYEDAKSGKQSIDNRINKVKQVAKDLFKEWEAEAQTLKNAKFRANSKKKLAASKARYRQMEKSLLVMQGRIAPVLSKMRDNVLYLKHNLNAKSLSGLEVEAKAIEAEIKKLLGTIDRSLKDSQAFSESLG